jgi:hypothetical protein
VVHEAHHSAVADAREATTNRPLAVILAEDLSRRLVYERQPIGGNAMAAFLTGCRELLATAGERRRLRMELARPEPVDGARLAAVASISDRRPTSGA